MDTELEIIIRNMTGRIAGILSGNLPSVYLYGSVTKDDFRPGWSDIDLLVLTEKQIAPAQAEELLHLRQRMAEETGAPEYRLFEGGMLSLAAFLSGVPDTVVYWGTSGERIADRYAFDSFCKTALLDYGVLLYGTDVRGKIERPGYEELRADVERHYLTVRQYAHLTGESLYSFGWLLDISRCIYTLRTGKILPKTQAGEWALTNGLCPVPDALRTALRVRESPAVFRNDAALRAYAANLNMDVQRYTDVLERELYVNPYPETQNRAVEEYLKTQPADKEKRNL